MQQVRLALVVGLVLASLEALISIYDAFTIAC